MTINTRKKSKFVLQFFKHFMDRYSTTRHGKMRFVKSENSASKRSYRNGWPALSKKQKLHEGMRMEPEYDANNFP